MRGKKEGWREGRGEGIGPHQLSPGSYIVYRPASVLRDFPQLSDDTLLKGEDGSSNC